MKIRIKQRAMHVGKPESCGCCVRLDWRALKSDRQLMKEIIAQIEEKDND